MGRRASSSVLLDTELDDLPRELRWRVWKGRVEAVIFAAPKPVTREVLARVVGKRCNLEAPIEDIRAELVDRPYELVAVAGGWQHRTRREYADAITDSRFRTLRAERVRRRGPRRDVKFPPGYEPGGN